MTRLECLSVAVTHFTLSGRLKVGKGAMIARPVARVIQGAAGTRSGAPCLASPASPLAAQALGARRPAAGTEGIHI